MLLDRATLVDTLGRRPLFRRRVVDLLAAGRMVADVARELGIGISQQAVYTWRRQEQIDRGLAPGLSTGEHGGARGVGRGETADPRTGSGAGGASACRRDAEGAG